MNRAASLSLYSLFLITILLSSCAGTPSGAAGRSSEEPASQAEDAEIPAAADSGYDPTVNLLVYQGWSVSMPPGWRAAVDHSGKGSSLFRLSHDLVRISVQPVDLGFDIDASKLTGYMKEHLGRKGKVVRNEEIESLPLSRDGRITVLDVERDAGGLHRVILEENKQGLFEWRITISEKREELYEDAVMRIICEAGLLDNREISRRVQESGFEFSSQGGLWRWYGDMDQGFLLESYIDESEPYTFLSIADFESLKEANHETEEWIDVIQKKSNEIRMTVLSVSGRPEKTKFWIQSENDKKKEVLFFVGEGDPVLFFLDLRNRKNMDYDVNAFLEEDSFKNLLDYSLKLPEAES